MSSNIIRTDSYKTSHFRQYPPNTEYVYSYLESRGGKFDKTVFFGLQYYLMKYLSTPITMADVDHAEKRINAHMGPGCFNRSGWERIVEVHNGYLPVKIKAVSEGTVVPTHNVLMTIENTDPELPWVTNYVESLLLKVWYPTTVATLSYHFKQSIAKYLEMTGDPSLIDFKLHDFGYRGVSSEESAILGSMAHLVNFKGTDTMLALEGVNEYYQFESNSDFMAGFSVPAAEHSTITAWGESNEYEAYQNMIQQFGNGGIYSVVSDSYDIFHACDNIWGKQLYKQVMDHPATLVVRPDSGPPAATTLKVMELLGDNYGFTTNEKGYKVLNKVRVLWGDGIDIDAGLQIMEHLAINGWSIDNIVFGMGGGLLQQVNRDTQKFAIKASHIVKGGRGYDVYKNPVGDAGKASKRGRLKLVKDENGEFRTVSEHEPGTNYLFTVWKDGQTHIRYEFEEIRNLAK